MWLLKEIVASFETGNEFDHLFSKTSMFVTRRPRGIPIGNLTSQLFVNIYLDALDQHLKHTLKEKYYIRYVDDLIILHHNKKHLHRLRNNLEEFLKNNLYLELHPKKQRIFPASQGIDFLGYVIFSSHCFLRKSNKERFRRKLKNLKGLYQKGKISRDKFSMSITSWIAHASHAKTKRLRERIFGVPLQAGEQKEIEKFIDSFLPRRSPIPTPSVQLRLF